MNIFCVDESPVESARALPDKHVVKMPLETCQMLSIVFSPWYHNLGYVYKGDGTYYSTVKGAFRNHPCTKWAAASMDNAKWLWTHGMALCEEYTKRYGKEHACETSLWTCRGLLPANCAAGAHTPFVRAMPEELKHDETISTIEAYRRYVASKPWAPNNYLRIPSRKPEWMS